MPIHKLNPESPTIIGMYEPVREGGTCYLEAEHPHPRAGFKYPMDLAWRPRKQGPRYVPAGEQICRECHREAFFTLHGFDPYDESVDRRTRMRHRAEKSTHGLYRDADNSVKWEDVR